MIKKVIVVVGLFLTTVVQAQISLGFVAGVNMCNEVTSFSLSPNSKANEMPSLKGVVVGPTIELMVPNYGIGMELGTFYSRKGSNFSYELYNYSYALQLDGYKEMDYLEMPLTLKWKFGPKDFKIFVSGGYYWGYAFGGTVGVEKAIDLTTGNQQNDLVKTTKMQFGDDESNKYNLIDRGYTCGLGVQIVRTIQLSVNYSYATKSHVNEKSIKDLLPEETYGYSETDFGISSKHSSFSVRLTYLFNSGGR
ncbi:MAG: PorT family protein [Paludibacteraceae bacterium]|nr:PorT family protein [Paludibacteraceae bacterium]MBN2787603.1 PorT family protein [Paludibacteraceae bacterium]